METPLARSKAELMSDLVAERRRQTLPIVGGVLTGLIAPALLGSPMLAASLTGEIIGLSPVLAAVIGAVVGAAVGWFDVPGRMAVALATREDLMALLLMAILSGVVMGALWGGAIGAIFAVIIMIPSLGPHSSASNLGIAMLGMSLLFGLLGAPGGTFYSLARALVVRRGAQWWLSPVSGVAGSVGAIVVVSLLYSVVAVIGFVIFQYF